MQHLNQMQKNAFKKKGIVDGKSVWSKVKIHPIPGHEGPKVE